MARYNDEEDERPRRRRSDDERRYDDDREVRRLRLMERRIRARELGYEDEDEDYEDAAPIYERPRISYAPSYGSASGGCASNALYAVLGVLALVLVGVLLAPYLLNRFSSSVAERVPQQLAQVIATPTPTLRDRGGTIQQIRSLNRLETQQFSVERVVEASIERGNVLDTLLGDRLLLIASGNVVAGVDLSKLAASDVSISADGKSISLRLPPSEIFSAALDNERTRVYDRQTGVLAAQNRDLETQARQSAEAEILQAACEGAIMQKAANDAQRSLEQFLKLLDFESVTVTATAGACQAPTSTNTAPTATP